MCFTGPASPIDRTACTERSDCDAQIGPLGCGVWACVDGACEREMRCTDGDGDGAAVGADCECAGDELDCDDGDPGVRETATAPCCNGGTRTCTNGIWNLCSGASGETCDGEDNDCNGVADDLGTFTCGLGACRNEVTACENGALGVCTPLPPASDVDGCNGTDDDCDGAVDEDCLDCLHVMPDGDDTLAATNSGATPFASIQAAVDFADSHRTGSNRVCVAAGASCGATATYAPVGSGDFTMRSGISVYANYESTCWTRCADSTTRLAVPADHSVVFPPEVQIQTILDGFAIDRAFSPNDRIAVVMDGARGAVLSNVTVGPVPWGADVLPTSAASGVVLTNGARAAIVRSRIEAGFHTRVGGYAVHAKDSEVSIEDNCGAPSDTSGRCEEACSANGSQLRGGGALDAEHGVVWLENSPKSRVERSRLCLASSSDAGAESVLRISGAAHSTQVRASVLGGASDGRGGTSRSAAVLLEQCNGAAPWVVDNTAIGTISRPSSGSAGVRALGDCHPAIEANRIGNAGRTMDAASTGVYCGAAEAIPSRCALVKNVIRGVDQAADAAPGGYPANVRGIGVECEGGSCARIERNEIVGVTGAPGGQSSAFFRIGLGVLLSGGDTLVADNMIFTGGERQRVGLAGRTTNAIEFNRISCFFSGSAARFEGNQVFGCYFGEYHNPQSPIERWSTVEWANGGGTVRSNCLSAGSGTPMFQRFPVFSELCAACDPSVFEDNGFLYAEGIFDWRKVYYVDERTTDLSSLAAVNALTDMTVSNNVATCDGMAVGPRN
jgi:hypothetical protein